MAFGVTILSGTAKQRGLAQASAFKGLVTDVQNVIKTRLTGAKQLLKTPKVKAFIEIQWAFSNQHAVDHMQELAGLAEGYNIDAYDLFTYLHVSTLDASSKENDGCTIVALSKTNAGPILAKNRDFGQAHLKLQQVVHHKDPKNTDNECVFVTSLGSPGAYSSGMNKYGLAVVDNHVGYSKPDIGWLRYFLMSELLWQAKNVGDALKMIEQMPHVGGGNLGLADKNGNIATVELGAKSLGIKTANADFLTHTNHFIDAALVPFQAKESEALYFESSIGRLNKTNRVLMGFDDKSSDEAVIALMASHGENSETICCHGAQGEGHTISSAIYYCAENKLQYCGKNPCSNEWQLIKL